MQRPFSIARRLSLLVLVSLPVVGVAQDNKQQMLSILMKVAKTSPDLAKDAKCLGIPEKQLIAAYEKSLNTCYSKNKEVADKDFLDALSVCAEKEILVNLNIDEAQADACMSAEEKLEDELMALEDKLNAKEAELSRLSMQEKHSKADLERINKLEAEVLALLDQQERLQDTYHEQGLDDYDRKMIALADSYGTDGPTEAQMSEMRALQAAQMQSQVEQTRQAMKTMAAISEETLGEITLPIYPNAKVLMHLSRSMQALAGESNGMLPAATFATKDSADKVVKYYLKNLADYQHKKLDDGQTIFLKKIPPGFTLMNGMALYMSEPHVLIKSVAGDEVGLLPQGTRTVIEIAYE